MRQKAPFLIERAFWLYRNYSTSNWVIDIICWHRLASFEKELVQLILIKNPFARFTARKRLQTNERIRLVFFEWWQKRNILLRSGGIAPSSKFRTVRTTLRLQREGSTTRSRPLQSKADTALGTLLIWNYCAEGCPGGTSNPTHPKGYPRRLVSAGWRTGA
jgi:hypothetical protein